MSAPARAAYEPDSRLLLFRYNALGLVAGFAAVERKGFLQAMLSRPVVIGLLSGLSRREQDDLLRLLAKAKEHAVEVMP